MEEEIVFRVNKYLDQGMDFVEFTQEIEDFGRSKNIPLIDILNWKDDLAIMAKRHGAMNPGDPRAAQKFLFLHFEMFKAKFAEALPKGSRPVTVEDSDSQ